MWSDLREETSPPTKENSFLDVTSVIIHDTHKGFGRHTLDVG